MISTGFTSTRLLVAIAALLVALGFSNAAAQPPNGDTTATDETLVIQLRIWQQASDSDDVWVSARLAGGDRGTFGTVPLVLNGREGGFDSATIHRFGNVEFEGVGLRVYQHVEQPQMFHVSACASACPDMESDYWSQPDWAWRPLGKTLVQLDKSIDYPFAQFRFGDIRIAIPRANPGLLADRVHLLAVRDVLEGANADLNWDIGTPAADWEGVTVAGSPRRITAISLSHRGLSGEVWGWLGELTELTELRLDGNALTGALPSKLNLLTNLGHLFLQGNMFDGCLPLKLRSVPDNDLDSLKLPDCLQPPPQASLNIVQDSRYAGPTRVYSGTYYFGFGAFVGRTHGLVFDVPPNGAVQVDRWIWPGQNGERSEPYLSIFEPGAAWGYVLRNGADSDTWLFLSSGGPPSTISRAADWERSHYFGCIYDCGDALSEAAWLERLAASLWVHYNFTYDYDTSTWNWTEQ